MTGPDHDALELSLREKALNADAAAKKERAQDEARLAAASNEAERLAVARDMASRWGLLRG
jgi:hypothetical protein